MIGSTVASPLKWGPCSAFRRSCSTLRCSLLSQIQPRLDYCIRVERQAFDPLVDQPLREVRMVRRALSAYTAVLARSPARLYRQMQQLLDCRLALIESFGDQGRVAIERQRHLRQVVRADRKTVEVLQELFRQERIRRDL